MTLFDLDRADIEDISVLRRDGEVTVNVRLNARTQVCPHCGCPTGKIKEYREKRIRHSVLKGFQCTTVYRARRYECPLCGRTFYEENPFAVKGSSLSTVTVYNVLCDLKDPAATFQSVARGHGIPASSVVNVFDRNVDIGRRTLPECLSIDECHAFSDDTSDYICVLVDFREGKITDILPSRRKAELVDYFRSIPLEERKRVKYVSMDMWKTYRAVAKNMLPGCSCLVDRFHIMQEAHRRLTTIRIGIMKRAGKKLDALKKEAAAYRSAGRRPPGELTCRIREEDEKYYLLKKFSFVLTLPAEKTDPGSEKRMNRKLGRYLNYHDIKGLIEDIDSGLAEAGRIWHSLHDFYEEASEDDAKPRLEKIIIECRTSGTEEMRGFANTLTEWKQEIINSLKIIPGTGRRMSNGPVENINRKIKLIRSSSNGYTNWRRFRNRVLYSINDEEITMKI